MERIKLSLPSDLKERQKAIDKVKAQLKEEGYISGYTVGQRFNVDLNKVRDMAYKGEIEAKAVDYGKTRKIFYLAYEVAQYAIKITNQRKGSTEREG